VNSQNIRQHRVRLRTLLDGCNSFCLEDFEQAGDDRSVSHHKLRPSVGPVLSGDAE